MKKIPTLFERDDHDRSLVVDRVSPGCGWVIDGQGIPREKLDGTAVLLAETDTRELGPWARYTLRPRKRPPAGFVPADDPDPRTGKIPGWVPALPTTENRYLWEAFEHHDAEILGELVEGTYELIGPRVQANRYELRSHVLVKHDRTIVLPEPDARTFDGLRDFLEENHVEGIVFVHPDGRMAKIKRRDFGIPWPSNSGLPWTDRDEIEGTLGRPYGKESST